MNNDLISRSELKKAIETYDKFACLPDGKLYPIRNLKQPEMFVTYIHVEDIIKAIDNTPTAAPEKPQGEYKTACNVLLSLEQIVRSSKGWEDSAVEAVHNAVQTAIKCMHERSIGDLITEEQAIDKLHETGWLPRHDKEMTERQQGEWKLHGMIYYCSVCGHDYEQGGNNFCGNCGADMRGEEP